MTPCGELASGFQFGSLLKDAAAERGASGSVAVVWNTPHGRERIRTSVGRANGFTARLL
jgi:hypothetical protein